MNSKTEKRVAQRNAMALRQLGFPTTSSIKRSDDNHQLHWTVGDIINIAPKRGYAIYDIGVPEGLAHLRERELEITRALVEAGHAVAKPMTPFQDMGGNWRWAAGAGQVMIVGPESEAGPIIGPEELVAHNKRGAVSHEWFRAIQQVLAQHGKWYNPNDRGPDIDDNSDGLASYRSHL